MKRNKRGRAEVAVARRPRKAADRWRPYPVGKLPKPLGGFVSDGAAALGCDPSYLALPLLVAAGAAIGNTRRLILKRGWEVCPVLWAAMVGDSGTAKSPAFRAVMRPVQELQRMEMEAHADAQAAYETKRLRYERDLSKSAGPPNVSREQ